MDSITKRRLGEATIDELARRSLGAGVTGVEELSGGTFNAVYGVTLADGRRSVLKVAPPPELELLTYEADLIHAEALFYRSAAGAGVPVPEVYAADLSRTLISSEYVFVEWLPGGRLADLAADLTPDTDAGIRRELGRIAARLHTVRGPAFGYLRRDGRTRSPRWRISFLAMVDDILADARRLGVDLGVPADRVAASVHRHAAVLDEVDRPVLVHFDLWDGNVLIQPDLGVAGLIDGERAFYGDPYAEFVSLALLRDVAELPDLIDGYAAWAGHPVRLDGAVRTRLTLYTAYLYLLMLTEGPTRGYAGEGYDAFLADLRGRLDGLLSAL
ncbi:phosphotransferase family protein [Planosporangium sp. 12N6]|uniref:phosphotransferase family protein n=1 Tax=Planosporangium spinosum TaxID=3402278 RepID=UPI003CF056DE